MTVARCSPGKTTHGQLALALLMGFMLASHLAAQEAFVPPGAPANMPPAIVPPEFIPPEIVQPGTVQIPIENMPGQFIYSEVGPIDASGQPPFSPQIVQTADTQSIQVEPPKAPESPSFASSPLLVGLPTAYPSGNGLIVQPEVQLGAPVNISSAEMDVRWLQMQRPSAELTGSQYFTNFQESVPPPPAEPNYPGELAAPLPIQNIEPMFQDLVQSAPAGRPRHTLWQRWWDPCPGTGLGQERLAYSLFDIDPAQPFNNFRLRSLIARRMRLPDRAEAFWQRTVDRAGPPLGESVLDYQQLNMRMELGSKKFSTAFEVPIRATNPELNRNHAGLGDMNLAVKTVLLDGEKWLFAQQFTTYFPTGSATMGLGRGKVALEPGLLVRNRWNDRTWMHGQLKFWFPLGADPQHGGQIINAAVGFNRVLWETDTAGLIPSLEFSTYSVLNGLARDSSQALRAVDGDSMFYITPGMHYVVDRKGDFGLLELGSGVSLATTNQRFTDSTWMFDVRWSW